MLYVFIDESGDLGFTERSTKYYVIASVETQDDSQFQKIFKKVRRKLKRSKYDVSEFKFTNTNKKTKLEILSRLTRLDISFSAVILDKNNIFARLYTKQQTTYNYILYNHIAESIIDLLPLSQQRKISLIIDKFLTNEHERSNFDNCIHRKVKEYCNRYSIIHPDIIIKHVSSQSSLGLQVADFVAGSIFNKYERGNDEYYRIIEPKIKNLKEKI